MEDIFGRLMRRGHVIQKLVMVMFLFCWRLPALCKLDLTKHTT